MIRATQFFTMDGPLGDPWVWAYPQHWPYGTYFSEILSIKFKSSSSFKEMSSIKCWPFCLGLLSRACHIGSCYNRTGHHRAGCTTYTYLDYCTVSFAACLNPCHARQERRSGVTSNCGRTHFTQRKTEWCSQQQDMDGGREIEKPFPRQESYHWKFFCLLLGVSSGCARGSYCHSVRVDNFSSVNLDLMKSRLSVSDQEEYCTFFCDRYKHLVIASP